MSSKVLNFGHLDPISATLDPISATFKNKMCLLRHQNIPVCLTSQKGSYRYSDKS